MPRFKPYDYNQMILLPITLKDQLEEGTLEHTIHELVDKKINMSVFEQKYNNDETGAPAIDPKILLKVVLLAYSRGTTGSRPIERCCKENIMFMAIAGGHQPDHSTISHFVSSMDKQIQSIFCDILLVCDQLDLLGGTHFSLDGLKLPSNASKEWSGTFKELKKKRGKLTEKLKQALSEHKRKDRTDDPDIDRRAKHIKKIEKQVDRLDRFLENTLPKQGKTKKEIQSNVTDNQSAKMPTSHGVIQGYNNQAMSDDKHQIIIAAESMSDGQDHDNLEPMLDNAKENMKKIGKDEDYFIEKILTADANYHNNDNIKRCEEEKIDAYIPDNEFRKRDEQFKDQERFKDGVTKRPKMVTERSRSKTEHKSRKEIFSWEDFQYDEEKEQYKCPNGKYLSQQSLNHKLRNKVYEYYRAKESDCRECPLRSECMSKESGKARSLLIPKGYRKDMQEQYTYSQMMKHKIDTAEGKKIYSGRIGNIEPPFANIRYIKRLYRLNFRGKVKVNIQWMLYCLVHNIEKINNYGLAY